MVRSDPSGVDRCNRKWCKICEVEKVGGEKLEQIRVPCYMTNIAYGFRCMRAPCWDGEKSRSIYEGESSRSGSVRFGQHFDLYRRNTHSSRTTSWMWEHTIEEHGGARGPSNGVMDYQPFVHGAYGDNITRILEEGVRIKDRVDSWDYKCLNSKNTYYKPQYTRLNYRALLD